MSIVACRITDSGFVMAADSISVRGWTQRRAEQPSKLFCTNGLIVGAVGFSEEVAMMDMYCTTHRPHDNTDRAMLEFISEFAQWREQRTKEYKIENAYLIGICSDKPAVYSVSGWAIGRVADFEAIGAGMDFALAALYLGHSVTEAVETAIELSVYCENPVQVLSWPILSS